MPGKESLLRLATLGFCKNRARADDEVGRPKWMTIFAPV